MKFRLVVAGGGTGGHLYPGIAVAREAQRDGGEALFIGTEQGIEARVIPREGLALATIRAGKYMGVGMTDKIKTLGTIPAGVFSSMRILKEFRPDAVMGVGGYASFPAVCAAKLLGLPVAIQEQNAYPGLTNRMLGRFAGRVFLGFAGAARFFPEGRSVFTGNPVRAELLAADRTSSLAKFGLKDGMTTVLVFGGSGGAHTVNRSVSESLPLLAGIKGKAQFIHQTGEKDLKMVEAAYASSGFNSITMPFIYEMAEAYACADLVVCRSGALTLAEITALGKPAVLVPYPFAANNHQELNARELEKAGAARVVRDNEATSERMAEEIAGLVNDAALLADMSSKARALGRPSAARDVLTGLKALAKDL